MAAGFPIRTASPGTFLAAVLWAVAGLAGPAAAATSPLNVVRVQLHQFEGGPPLSSGFEFYPGDHVFLSFRVGGYQLSREDDVHLEYRVDAFDPAGLRLQKPVRGTILTQLSWQDKRRHWMPIVRCRVGVPPTAPSGRYRLRIEVDDVLANRRAHRDVAFRVHGRAVAPSDRLVVRNFRFLRSETSLQPLSPAAYRPGDSVWARFEITGYRFGENNHFSVDYGVQVRRASGQRLYEQPVAATESRSSYYPRRYVSGSLSLKLTPDLAKGAYTLVLTVHDRIGGQTCRTGHVFTVE